MCFFISSNGFDLSVNWIDVNIGTSSPYCCSQHLLHDIPFQILLLSTSVPHILSVSFLRNMQLVFCNCFVATVFFSKTITYFFRVLSPFTGTYYSILNLSKIFYIHFFPFLAFFNMKLFSIIIYSVVTYTFVLFFHWLHRY